MQHDDPCEPVKQEPVEQSANGGPINPPPSPDDPHPTATQSISRQEVQSDVRNIEDRVKRAELWMIWLTAAIAFSGFCAVGVGIMQWREIHAGSTDTHDLAVAAKTQAEKMQSMSDAADKIRQAAENMVVQDQRIADNAKTSIDASRDALRTDQRAWMDIAINAPATFQADRTFSTSSEMKNLGKTPAKNIQVGYIFEGITPRPAHLMFDDTRLKFINAGILPPQGPDTMPVEITPGYPDELLGTRRFEAIRDGVILVYYWGIIKYDDVFGFHHWLKFCYVYNVAHRRFDLVAAHNDIDKETR